MSELAEADDLYADFGSPEKPVARAVPICLTAMMEAEVTRC